VGQIRTIEEQQQHQILTAVFSKPITPCPLSEAPLLHYQTNMAIIISEETADASAWTVTYRGLVGTTREDMKVLEDKAPLWLLECLLGNRLPLRDPVKVVSHCRSSPVRRR
jgi:WD repeat-containing protein 48